MGTLEEECLEWMGYINERGYGERKGDYQRDTGTKYVHRQTYIFAHGPIPEEMVIMHMCDNPACYRLSHLKLGTQADNVRDAAEKGRNRKGKVYKPKCSKCGELKTWYGGQLGCEPCQRKYQRERYYERSNYSRYDGRGRD